MASVFTEERRILAAPLPRFGRIRTRSVVPWGASAVFAVVYTCISVVQHRQMRTAGFDLGIFEQAVRAYAHLQAPIVPLKGPHFDILGDHFSPVIAILAPFYRIWPTPYVLLVAQAVLAAVSVVPLAQWAYDLRGTWWSLWASATVGCSWGIAEMVHFDFHEVAFAVPLLSFAVVAAGRERWRASALWSLPLVLVKEDLGFTVGVLGLYMVSKGARRIGWPLAACGIAASCLEMFVIIPAMNPSGVFDYSGQLGSGHSPVSLLLSVLWPAVKWQTLVMILLPSGFLCLRSPLLLLAVPTLAWRFAADNPSYWGTLFHYNAVLMPIAFGAALDGISRTRPAAVERWGAAIGAVFTAATIPVFPIHQPFLPKSWSISAHVRAAESLIRDIPPGQTVDSSNRLAAQLAGRDTVAEVCPFTFARPASGPVSSRWVIYDTSDPTGARCRFAARLDHLTGRRLGAYTLVARRDGVLLLKATGP